MVTQNLDEAVTKTSTDEYSPMPSEEAFENRQPSVDRNESLSPQVETTPKPLDSDVEVPKVVPTKKRKGKKKKSEAAAAAPEQVD